MKYLLLLILPVLVAFKVPTLTGPVVDDASLLSSEGEQRIERALLALNDKKGTQIQVLTMPTLDGVSVEEASLKVVEEWKLGTKKGDRGVLLLVAVNDRKIRIEVGQGLEGELPDAIASRIIRDSIRPLFKSGDYASGVLVGIAQIIAHTDPDFNFEEFLEGIKINRRQEKRGPSGSNLFFIIVFFIFLVLGGRSRGRYGPSFGSGHGYYRGSGGGGFGGSGGGWSGGGGGFSGGGASGSW